MAFLNKFSKCFNVALRIENRIYLSSTTRNLRLKEARLYCSLIKESKHDLAKTGRFYVTEAASTTAIKDQTTATETKDTPEITKEVTKDTTEPQKNSTEPPKITTESLKNTTEPPKITTEPSPQITQQSPPINYLSSALGEADSVVRRYGRLTTQEVENLMNKCKPGISSNEAVMMIKCTGELLKTEGVVARRAMFEKVLKRVTECCPAKSAEMLNAEMAIRIENKVDFDPAQVLATFEELQLTPSKHTFHLLLTQYCLQGSVDKALDILNHMKANDWMVSALTIHTILKAYTKKGDKEECTKLMEEMSQHGLRPTPETYLSILQAHASNGDVEAIKLVMREMSDKRLNLTLRHSYDVVLVMVEESGGDDEKIAQVMEIVGLTDGTARGERLLRENRLQNRMAGQQRFIDFQDTSNVVFQLLAGQHYTAAVLVLKSFSDQLYNLDKDESNIILKLFISQLIKNDVPLADLHSFRDQLVEANFLMREWEPIVYYVIRLQNIDYVLRMFEDLKSKSFQLKVHYFWPLFHQAIKSNKQQDMLKLIEFMLQRFGHLELSTTLYNWCMVPLVQRNKGAYKAILDDFKNIGMSRSMRDLLELSHLVFSGLFSEAHKLVEEGSGMNVSMLKRGLANGIKSENYKAEEFFKFMHALNLKLERPSRISAQIMVSCIKSYPYNNNNDNDNNTNNTNDNIKLEEFINGWIDADIKLEQWMMGTIRNLLQQRKVSQGTIKRLSMIGVGDRRLDAYDSALTSDLRADGLTFNVNTTEKIQKPLPQLQKQPPQPQEHADVLEARRLLNEKNFREFRTLVHSISEKPDLEMMRDLEAKVKLPASMVNFFNRKLMMAHLNGGGQSLMMEKLNGEDIGSFISANVLIKMALKDPSMLAQVDTLLREKAYTIKGKSAHISLYHYYIGVGDVDKAREVLESKPEIRGMIRLGQLSYKARQDKNEAMMRSLMQLHKDGENPRRLAVCHSNLILLKCEMEDSKGAEQAYHDAITEAILFEHLSIRCLQALQSLMQSNKLPLPWKEGELEKRIEEAAKPPSSSSSSSDSDTN